MKKTKNVNLSNDDLDRMRTKELHRIGVFFFVFGVWFRLIRSYSWIIAAKAIDLRTKSGASSYMPLYKSSDIKSNWMNETLARKYIWASACDTIISQLFMSVWVSFLFVYK